MGNRNGFFYGWVIVAVSITALMVSGGAYQGFGVFFKPLEAEFGWSRGITSLSHTAFSVAYGISLIVMGRLADKYGPRLVFSLGAILIAVGFSLSSQINSPQQLYLFYTLAGLGTGCAWGTTLGTVQRWFVKRRGLAVSIASMGIGLGITIFIPILNQLISGQGWRTTYIIFGIVTGSLFALAAWLLVATPEKKGLRPYGVGENSSPENVSVKEASGWTTSRAIRHKSFAIVTVSYTFSLIPISMIIAHFVPYATYLGIPSSIAAGAFALIGAASIGGRLLGGLTTDWISWKSALILFCLLRGLTIIPLPYIRDPWMFYVFAIVYGVFQGAQAPQYPGIIGDLFGTTSLSELIGISTGIALIAGAAGPPLAGFIFDKTGSYTLAFLIAAGMLVLAGVFVLFLKHPKADSGAPVAKL